MPNKRELNIFRILKNNEALAIPTEFDPLKKAGEHDFFDKKA